MLFGILFIITMRVCSLEGLITTYLPLPIRQIQKQKIVWFGLVAMFLLSAGFTLICSREITSLIMLSRTFGQIVMCLLLVVRPPVLGLRAKVGITLP